ncbi:Spherulation-specific family 4-domain-containing protein [Roridomyces roridus]|uniref:Spherulation-specific family 4-domain-containing protein n=1 Tax=Roridomyces roridus TaxID=1738132 RepID=A0AAD7BGB4_9AGAR|nr:Spherulation-specific family 4-domain-containing protein [Roridomyces roridus]
MAYPFFWPWTLVSYAHALAVLLPLYAYPQTDCSAWTPVFSAISSHPTSTFYIIINPDDGPGPSGTQPGSDFVECIPKLRVAGSRAVLLGYVDTGTNITIESAIDTYAGWDSAYRPSGIFLDGVSPTEKLLSTYQGYVSHATNAGFNFTALDAGETVSSSYLDMVDLVNTFEDSYASFSPSGSLSGTLGKQSVILTGAPSNGTALSATVDKLQSLGVGAVYITDESNDSASISSQFASLVDAVAGITVTPTTASPSSTPTSASTAIATSSQSHHSSHASAIATGVLGGLVLTLGLLTVYVCVRRGRRVRARELAVAEGKWPYKPRRPRQMLSRLWPWRSEQSKMIAVPYPYAEPPPRSPFVLELPPAIQAGHGGPRDVKRPIPESFEASTSRLPPTTIDSALHHPTLSGSPSTDRESLSPSPTSDGDGGEGDSDSQYASTASRYHYHYHFHPAPAQEAGSGSGSGNPAPTYTAAQYGHSHAHLRTPPTESSQEGHGGFDYGYGYGYDLQLQASPGLPPPYYEVKRASFDSR